jgi:hypothetical protein
VFDHVGIAVSDLAASAAERSRSAPLLVVDGDVPETRARLAANGLRVYDQTSVLAAFELEGKRLLRRLTGSTSTVCRRSAPSRAAFPL